MKVMKKKPSVKKLTRGISNEFAKAFRDSQLYELYEKHKHELLIGVRNNYLNLYYNCDSISKITYTNDSISCEIDRYYLDGKHYASTDKEKRYKIKPNEICEKFQEIKKQSDFKKTPEKKAQSKLVLLNNGNQDSNWFCIDVEYVKSFFNRSEKEEASFKGRFDIIALSKEEPHRVALIELKYGRGAIGGSSGIYKHIDDFIKFGRNDFFKGHLKQEIIEILKSQIALGLSIPFKLPIEFDVFTPEFYFITLDNNAKNENASTPQQTMAGYLFKDCRWGCKRLTKGKCVENDFGDVTKKTNEFHATFLFSSETLEDLSITDIIDGSYDERILPV